MKRQLSYLKALVICHGKSEKQMCDYIKSNLRIRIEVISDKNGEKSIQITSIKKFLNGLFFKNSKSFRNRFEDIEESNTKTKIPDNFKVFIIMDTDDCTEEQRTEFINKNMFKDIWLYDFIVPIYNTPCLESVLQKSGINFESTGRNQKKEYIKIFPTDKNYIKSDTIQVSDFAKNLRQCKNTNLYEFIEFCLDIAHNC